MSYRYDGRVAVVTGASSGIGRAITIDLAKRGVKVLAAARRSDMLQHVAAECDGNAEAIPTDVADRAQCEALVARALEGHGRLDILVNNAGIPMRIHAKRLRVEDVERAMQVNFMGAVYCTFAALPSMLERKDGHIVNIASVAGRYCSPRESAYSASKFAMTGLSEGMAADLQGSGVNIHVVYPGPIETEIWGKVNEPAAYRGKLYPPQIIADAVRSCIEHNHFERWAPRRLATVELVRSLAPNRFLAGVAKYDRRSQR